MAVGVGREVAASVLRPSDPRDDCGLKGHLVYPGVGHWNLPGKSPKYVTFQPLFIHLHCLHQSLHLQLILSGSFSETESLSLSRGPGSMAQGHFSTVSEPFEAIHLLTFLFPD